MTPRRVLITGGSRGIGAALVRRFAAAGDMVAFTYLHSEAQAHALEKETGARAFRADARDEKDTLALKDALRRCFHSLDILVSNAGTSVTGCVEDTDAAAFDDLFAVHVRGAFLATRAFLPMLRQNGGAIVYISSMWGQVGASCEVAYSAAKAALIGMTKALAKEAAPSIRVNCVAPGVVDTDMMKEYSDSDRATLIEQTPLARLGTAEDVARAVFFLCSSDASFITGDVLSVSGGFVI